MVFMNGKPRPASHYKSIKQNMAQKNQSMWWLRPTIVFGIILLAIFLRLYQLDKLPPSIFIDEYNLFSDALKIVTGEPHPPWYGIGWYGTPQLSIVIFSWFIKIFGTSWFSFKLAWGIPAFLLLPVVYKLARHLLDRPSAVLTLLILTFAPIHIHLSRWAHGAIIITTLNMTSALFWYLGVVRNKLYFTVLSAGFFALSLHTYVGARSFMVFFGLAFLGYFVYGLKKHRLQMVIKHTLVFGLTWFLLMWPHLNYGRLHSVEMWARTQELSIIKPDLSSEQNWQRVQNNFRLYTRMILGISPDPNLRHDPLQQAVLPFPLVWLSMIGLAFLIWRKKWSVLYLILSLTLASMIGGLLSIEAPSIFRTNQVLVPVALLAGYATVQLWQLLSGRKKKTWLSAGWLVLLVVFLISGSVMQLRQYFALADQPSTALQEAFTAFENSIARQTVAELTAGRQVFLSSDYFWFSATQYQAGSQNKSEYIHLFEPTADPMIWSGATLILDPSYTSVIDYLTVFFPDLHKQLVTTATRQSFWLIRVPDVKPAVTQTKYGLRRTCRSAEETTEIQTDPTIFIGWGDIKPTRIDTFDCTWTGQLQIPEKSNYTFFTLADDMLGLEISDEGRSILTLPSGGTSQGQVTLSAKTYQIQANYHNTGGASGAYVYVQSDQDAVRQALPPLWLRP